MEKIVSGIHHFGKGVASIGKTLLCSGWRTADFRRIERTNPELVVLGNGPSLTAVLEAKSHFLQGKDLMCVNYSVTSPYFEKIRPRYYIATDPLLYTDSGACKKTFGTLAGKTEWELHLFVPYRYRKLSGWRDHVSGNPNIRVHLINTTPVQGSDWIAFPLYRKRLGMPRPWNVLIPALMSGIWTGYKTIYTAGVEHSWHLNLWVNDNNELMINDVHYYDGNTPQNRRHGNFRMDTILHQLTTVFAGYHTIERFSSRVGVKIYNVTEGSFIDAFKKIPI